MLHQKDLHSSLALGLDLSSLLVEKMDKINPAEFGRKMYGVMIGQGMTHEQALYRALCIACDEQRGRCAEICMEVVAEAEAEAKAKPHARELFWSVAEGGRKAADKVWFHMPPSNLCSDGILR
jgi:hypothetical protein